MASDNAVAKQVDVTTTPQADLEAESNSQNQKDWLYKPDRGEVTEITPVEAFQWNVEGDQSPCMFTLISPF